LTLLLASAAPAQAQVANDTPILGAGVSILFDNDDDSATGFWVDLAKNLKTTDTVGLGVVGDFGFHRFTDGDVNITSYMGGVRVAGLGSRVKPFAQFLVGVESCCDTTEFAWQPGGGVDIMINDRVNFRAQYDFRVVQFEGDAVDESRFSFGLSFPLGRQ
jgi:opacity protein-like surface antigen